MTATIDGRKAIKLLTNAVKLKGADYVDPNSDSGTGCRYVEGGAPACIVGHVVAEIKPDILPLIEVWERHEADSDDRYSEYDDRLRPPTLEEGHPGDCDASSLIGSIRASGVDLEFTDDAERILAAAQGQQDRGKTWGEALAEAKRLFRDVP